MVDEHRDMEVDSAEQERERCETPRENSAESKEQPQDGRREADKDDGQNDGTVLFVGSVPDIKDNELEEIFAKVGKVVECRILRDPHTKLSRGIAFVEFEDKETSDRAIQEIDGHECRGSRLVVKVANRKRPHSATPGTYLGKKNDSSRYSSRGPTSYSSDSARRAPDRYEPRSEPSRDRYAPSRSEPSRDRDRYEPRSDSGRDRYEARSDGSRGRDRYEPSRTTQPSHRSRSRSSGPPSPKKPKYGDLDRYVPSSRQDNGGARRDSGDYRPERSYERRPDDRSASQRGDSDNGRRDGYSREPVVRDRRDSADRQNYDRERSPPRNPPSFRDGNRERRDEGREEPRYAGPKRERSPFPSFRRERSPPPRNREPSPQMRDRVYDRREEPRREDVRREEPRREGFRREEPRREDVRREEPRREGFRREEPRRDHPVREECRRDDRGDPRRDPYDRREEPRRDEPRRDTRRDEPHYTERRPEPPSQTNAFVHPSRLQRMDIDDPPSRFNRGERGEFSRESSIDGGRY